VDHAKRFGLTFDTLKFPWGQAFDLDVVQQFLSRSPAVEWLWCVHSETSTGMLNPLPALQTLCAKKGIKVCADCISSIGLVPVNLERIYLASGASGKGLAAYPGLSMVYYNHSIASTTSLPRYLDLGWYAEHQGIAFTHSSNLMQALDAAVRQQDWEKKYAEVIEVSTRLRARLRELGFRLIATDAEAMPGVVTITLPPGENSSEFGQKLQKAGFLLSYNSDYLRRRNWIQICLMGEYSKDKIEALLTWLARHPVAAAKQLPANAVAARAL
jgi:aspartate aminotransferase-like enzyme